MRTARRPISLPLSGVLLPSASVASPTLQDAAALPAALACSQVETLEGLAP